MRSLAIWVLAALIPVMAPWAVTRAASVPAIGPRPAAGGSWIGAPAPAAELREADAALAAALDACPVTPYSTGRPLDAHTASWSSRWYGSPDGRLWVAPNWRWYAGPPGKVLWGKPAGAELRIAGRRLDGDAPPLDVDLSVSPAYRGDVLNPTGIGFPTEGCWEVEGAVGDGADGADGSVLRFVAFVYPQTWSPAFGPRGCPTPRDRVLDSDVILVARVEASEAGVAGFWWHRAEVLRAWKGPLAEGDRFDLLQDAYAEAPIGRPLDAGRTYVFFAQRRPGGYWRALCPGVTLAEVVSDGAGASAGAGAGAGDRLADPAGGETTAATRWMGGTLAELEAVIGALLPAG